MGIYLPGMKKAGRPSGARRRFATLPLGGPARWLVEETFMLGQESAVPQAGEFPAGHTVTGQQRRQQQVHDVRFG